MSRDPKVYGSDSLERRKDGRTVVDGSVSDVVFGPVHSRRYGLSLGINLLPRLGKICSFDCPYCECGPTDLERSKPPLDSSLFPARRKVREAVKEALGEIAESGESLDIIMQAGNGEPTLHPEFLEITRDLVRLRNRLTPEAKLGILSNGGTLGTREIRKALLLYDERVLKLDAGTEEMFRKLSNPLDGHTLEDHTNRLREFRPFTLQAMFVRGRVDNTGEEEVRAWIERVRSIQPEKVHIYSLDRRPADPGLKRAPQEFLRQIARRVKKETGIECSVF